MLTTPGEYHTMMNGTDCIQTSTWAGNVVRTFDNRTQKRILEQSLRKRRHIGMAKCRRMPPICSIQKNWHAAARCTVI
jgi:hypothetical protein